MAGTGTNKSTAFVYLLVHKNESRFKIGKAVDIRARVAQLKLHNINFERSNAWEMKDDEAANNLERALHRCFAKWRIRSEVVAIEHGQKFDGYTEWFSIDCYARVNSFMLENSELFDHRKISSDELAKVINARRLPRKTRTRSAQHISVEDCISSVVSHVNRLLPSILEVVHHSDVCAVVKSGPGRATLKGTFTTNFEDMRERIFDLIDTSKIMWSSGCGINLFSSCEIFNNQAGARSFELNYLLPENDGSCLISNAAVHAMSALPIPVPGWGEMLEGDIA